jgi:hypothetical protein
MQCLALSYLLGFCNEDQLKSNKEYSDGPYAVLALVKTDKKRLDTHSWKIYNNLEDYQDRIVSWKIEDQNGIRKQP